MPDYQNGKIYKIVCNNTGKQYVGSTTQKYLCNRLAKHKSSRNTSSSTMSREIIEGGNYSMVLVELCPCNSKDELHKRERHFIETLDCINKQIPGRTDKEYREDNKEKYKEYYEANKEKIDEYKKEWYESNKQQIKQKQNEKHNCECGGVYSTRNKARHMKSKKHLDYLDDN